MKIGVSGASGQLGKNVLKVLSLQGNKHTLVGISRTPENVSLPASGRHGDFDHPATLKAAYQDLDALLIIPGVDLRPGVRSAQHIAAIDAAVNANVKHIVFVSVVGTKEEQEPDMGAAYWAGEQHLMKTAQQWTILRMNYYAEAFALEVKQSLTQGIILSLGENKVAFVSRDDLAAAAASILLGGSKHSGVIYHATGAKSFSLAERVALASEITGQTFKGLHLDMQQLHQALVHADLHADVIRAVEGIQTKFINGAFDIVTGDIALLTGQPPRELRDILVKNI